MQSPHYRATGETIVAGGGSPPQKVESPPPAGLAYRQESEEVAMQDRSGSDAEAEEQQGTAQLDTAQSWGQHRPRSRPYALEDRHELTAGVLAVSAGGGGRRGAAVAGAHTPPDGAYCAGAYSACHSARSEWQHWGALEPSEGEEGGSAARAPANAARPASQWAREGAAPEDAVPLPSARVEPLQGFLAAGPSPGGTPGGGGRWLPQGRHAYRLGDDRAPGAAAAWVAIAPDPQAGDGAHWHTVVCVSATLWGDAALRLRALGAVLDVDLPRDMALAVMGADAVVARERSASGSPHGRFCASVPAGGDQPEGWHAPLWLYLAAVQRSVRECVPLCRAVREGPRGEDVHLRCYGAAAGPASVLAVVQGCGTVHADLRSGTVRATRGEEGGEGGDHLSVHLDDSVEQAGGLPHWAAPLLCAALQCAGDLLRGLCPGKEQGQAVDAADTLAPGDSASESAWQDQWPGEEGAAVSWSAASLLSAAGPAVVGADATHMHTERVGEWAAPDAVGAGKGLPCERAARELVQEVQRLVEGPPLAAAADSDAGEAQARGGGGGGGGLARLADAGPGTEVTTKPRVSALAAADTPPLPRSAEAIDQGPRGSERATEKDGVGAPRRAVVDWWRDQGTGQLCVIWRPPAAAAAPASRLDVERWSLSADGRTLRRGGAFGRTFPTAPSAAKLPAPARAVLRAMLHILDQEQ